MLPRPHRFSLWLLFIFALRVGPLLPDTLAGEKAPVSKASRDDFGSIVKMSPYEVVADRIDFVDWIRVSSPHFVLYTDADAKTAATLVKHMEMVHQAAQFYLHRKSINLAPLIIVLPTGESDWDKIANKRETEWNLRGSTVGSSRKLLLVHYDWQKLGLGAVWMRLGWHERESRNLEGPLWFRSGMGLFFLTVAFDQDTLTLGRQGSEGNELKLHGWIDWPNFFRIDGRSSDDLEGIHSQFEAQSTLVVHYALTNPEPGWTARLFAWAAYLEAGNAPTEESFKQFFGLGWKDWQHQLDGFLKGGKYAAGTIRFPPEALQFPVESVQSRVREMRELFVLSQIESQDIEDSDASLDTLLARGLKTDSLREVLADACGRRGRTDAQLQELRRLIDLRSTNPVVYFDAAYILNRRKLAGYPRDSRLKGEGGDAHPAVYADAAFILNPRQLTGCTLDSRLDSEEGDEIRGWCRKAIELEPLYLEANELLAWSKAFAPTVEKANLDTIAGICRVLDKNARTDNVLTALAIAQWRMGNMAEARSLAERIHGSVFSGSLAKRLAQELLARLGVPNTAVAPPPATPSETPRAAK